MGDRRDLLAATGVNGLLGASRRAPKGPMLRDDMYRLQPAWPVSECEARECILKTPIRQGTNTIPQCRMEFQKREPRR